MDAAVTFDGEGCQTPVEHIAACQNMAAHLRQRSHETSGLKRIALICRAIEFDRMAAMAEHGLRQRGVAGLQSPVDPAMV
jgi:hypothetical protein